MQQMPDLSERTVLAVLDAGAERHPEKIALRSPEESYSYAALRQSCLQVGGGLVAQGVGRQEPVLLMLDNHLDHMLTVFGTSLTATVAVEVNPAYKGNMLAYVINNSLAKVMVMESHYCDRLASVGDQLSSLETVIVRGGGGEELKGRFRVHSFEELRLTEPVAPANIQPWDLYGIVYTSGTTGPSKGVMVSHAEAYCHFHPAHFGAASPDDVTMVTLPLFHMAGQWAGVYNALISGASAVVFDGFHATKFWDEVREYGCTFTLLLGAMANFLYRQPPSELDLETPMSRVLMVPVIPEVEDFKRRFGVEVGTGYGLTEGSSPIVAPFGTATPKACGFVRSDFEARVVDENDVEVKPGEVGELIIRAKEPWTTMSGYWNMPEATVAAWRNLWFHTGDGMYRDENGQFFFVDRKKDAIRRRGENVSSFEVEAEINSHPAVLESAVIAHPSEHTEDDIKAVVVLKPGEQVSEEELLHYLVVRLPYFMVPRYIELVDALPKTPSEKIRKSELRERGNGPKTWDREVAGIKVTRHS